MRVDVELTRGDYEQTCYAPVEGEPVSDPWKPWRVSGVTTMTAAVFLWLAPCGVPRIVSGALLALGLLLVSFAVVGADRAVQRAWVDYSKALGRATWEFTDDGATLHLPAEVLPHPWSVFSRFVEVGGVFLLYQGDGIYIIPKRAVENPDELRQLRRLLEEKVQPPLNAFPVVPSTRA